MANYSLWNVRRRHEWLAKPLKKERVKRRSARRIGLLDAWHRKAPPAQTAQAAPSESDGEAASEGESATESATEGDSAAADES